MEQRIKVLILEDVPTDAELAEREISVTIKNCIFKIVETRKDFINALDKFHPDVIIADYQLPQFDGMIALHLSREKTPLVPFIMHTGSINEDTAVECMKAGATDYVIKEHMKRLGPAVKRALELAAAKKDAQKAQQELVESEARFRKLAENASDMIYRYDFFPERRFVYVSPSSTQMTGYTPDEYYSDPELFKKLVYPDDRDKIGSLIISEHESGGKMLTMRWVRKDGKIIWTEQKNVYIHNKNGNLLSTESIVRDITGRKKAEEDLKAALEKAEQGDRLKTSFLNNLSHEIRTPLNAIVGFSDMIKDQGVPREHIRYCIDVIHQSSDQLIHVVEDIISISTIETGQLEIYETEFELEQMMSKVKARFNIKAELKGVELNYSIDVNGGNTMIISDMHKIERILTHLVDNALKFTDEGLVEFGCTLENRQLQFFVSDTGIGIDKDMHEKIFQRFHQAEIELSQKRGGLGLGLPVSKAFIESLGGRIWLESQPGSGSVFYFTIPWKPVKAERKRYDKTAKTARRKLLVAEDEESNYLLLKEMLGDFRTKILHATNGRQAIELVEKHPDIDLVLMDIKMPVMGGYEATKLIKSSRPYLPVIALTAHALPGDREKAIEAGCDEYLSKPFMRKDLKEAINKFLV